MRLLRSALCTLVLSLAFATPALATPRPATVEELDRYAERERAQQEPRPQQGQQHAEKTTAEQLEEFQGGRRHTIETTTVIIVLLVVILVVLVV